ncbi:cytochrome b5-like heme/steroid binding domain-containing protein [Skeletonema marinoi]|uniref:Cytochrome b5-like heme/steroid binding domain-containing protein n=1 Tax=Skeletonema marinoi TaxID=267567 RepID=A0AAD9DEX2_9STRA|nr:cytochrome b5-like heme/steroid binding domain-containing protein [Skeletonema marinoi]
MASSSCRCHNLPEEHLLTCRRLNTKMTLSHAAKEMGKWCDGITGVEGSSGYLALIIVTAVGWLWINDSLPFQANGASTQIEEEEEEEVPDPPRNFTITQLRHFDGTVDQRTDEKKPVYLSVNGTVFDVSNGRDFYGPGGPYEVFAGRECGAALATMSFDEKLLDDVSACENLGVGDRNELQNWMEKFEHYRCYPIKGKLVPDDKLPSPDRIITMEELGKYDGNVQEVPEEFVGYGAAPIYVGAGNKVFDVSFGGVPMYGRMGHTKSLQVKTSRAHWH